MKIPRKTPRDNIFELISQANAFLDFLPPNRARSMVATKLDEAVLWLTQVEPDESPDPAREQAARELDREIEEACDELRIDYPEPTHEELRAFRSLMDRIKADKQADEYPEFPSDAAAFAAGPPLKAKEPHFVNKLPDDQVRAAARLWRNAVKNLDKAGQTRATSQMRTIIARIEEGARRKDSSCPACKGTGWMERWEITPCAPFSQNYMPCLYGCGEDRGHGDPIPPYDYNTGKIVTTDTEDDGA